MYIIYVSTLNYALWVCVCVRFDLQHLFILPATIFSHHALLDIVDTPGIASGMWFIF